MFNKETNDDRLRWNKKTRETGADNLPIFVKARVDHAVRIGLLDRNSKRVNVLAAISSESADQYIDAALSYLAAVITLER